MNLKSFKRAICIILVFCTSVLFFGCNKKDDSGLLAREPGMESDVITIGIQANAQFLPLYIAKEKHYIEDALLPYGISVVWNEYNTAIPLNRALDGGICDMGIMGDVPAVLGVAQYDKTKLIGMTSHAPDNYSIIVKNDSDIRSAKDLAGRNVGTVYGSTAHLFLKQYLESEGLSLSDVNITDINVGNALSYIENNELDAVCAWEPHCVRTVELGAGRYLSKGSKVNLFGGFMFVARKDSIDKDYHTLKIILEQYEKASKEVSSMDDDFLNEIATDLSINKGQLKSILPEFDFSEIRIKNDDIRGLQRTCNFLYELDIITEEIDADNIVNRNVI